MPGGGVTASPSLLLHNIRRETPQSIYMDIKLLQNTNMKAESC